MDSKTEKERHKMQINKRIFVCSPYKGDIEKNVEFAKDCCRFVTESGHYPFAPHLFCTQYLDDNNEAERDLGINCGMAFLEVCDELWYFGNNITSGMEKEIGWAKILKIPVRHFEMEGDK